MPTSAEIELQNYTLESEIGRGDLTVVFRGTRKSDGEPVAIKLVPPQFTFDEIFVRRFLDMGKQAARLEHPNIVRTFEAQKEGEHLFLVREWVDARSLAQVLDEESPLGSQRTINIARQIASALDYAHQKSIMHGDLSARRVYVAKNDRVIVADFGQMQAMAGTSLVRQGFAIGAPEVLAPERVRGQGPSRQSDLYSLGTLCYQMLHGEPPFSGDAAAVLHAQAYEQPKPLYLLNPEVSVQLSEAVARMLSKGLELRYATGAEFARALTVAAEGTAPVRVSSTATGPLDAELGRPVPFWKKPWFWGIIAVPAVLILLLAGFLAISTWIALAPPTAREPSNADAAPTVAQQTAGNGQSTTAPPPASDDVVLIEPSVEPGFIAPQGTATPTPPPTVTPLPTATPTLVPLPTPGPPIVAEGSPFTNLVLAHGITADNQPERIGDSFAPGSQPVYLFFDYANIEPGTNWSHRWTWGDTELGTYPDVWPDNYFETGTAWVFFSPTGGFQPGPYQVTIEVEGKVVGTATFVVQPGGI